ncbi:MAG: low molecular weight protein-tyrosine-phosphatase [Pseudomonadota bacterium]
MKRILFVCLGNICRSPTAHGVFRQLVTREGLVEHFEIESAGTGDWHIGKAPDTRALAKARERGIDISDLRARPVLEEDFFYYHHIFAMDYNNLSDLLDMAPPGGTAEISLFLDWLPGSEGEPVPDPYYGGEQGFDNVFDWVEEASLEILKQLRP